MASRNNAPYPISSEEEEEESDQEEESEDSEEEGSEEEGEEEDENYIPLPEGETELQDFLGFAPTISEVVSHAVRLVSGPRRGRPPSRQGARPATVHWGRPRGRGRATRGRAVRVGEEVMDGGSGEGQGNIVDSQVASTLADSHEQRHTTEGNGGQSGEGVEKYRPGTCDGEEQDVGSSGKSSKMDADPQSLPNCPICMEPWTSEGVHRVCCLPCGHVYGRSCVERWIRQCRTSSIKCPHCNTKFKGKQIINLYAPRIAAVNDDMEKTVRLLRQKNECLISEKSLLLEEIRKYKRQISELENSEKKRKVCINDALSQGTQRRPFEHLSAPTMYPDHTFGSQSSFPGGGSVCSFVLQMECKLDEARAMDIDIFNQMLIISRTPPGLGAGQAISKVSLAGPGAMHNFTLSSSIGTIKDICIAPVGIQRPGGLALLASLGKKLSILSMESNNIVLQYDLPAASWSCAWDINNPGFVYAGLQSGTLMVFDIRQTSRPVQTNTGLSCNPIHSIQTFMKHQDGSTVATASSIGPCLWDDNPTAKRPVLIPEMEEQGVCISLATCGYSSDNMVASFRPKAGAAGDNMNSSLLTQPSSPSVIGGGKLGTHVLLSRAEDNYLKKCQSARGNVSEVRMSRSTIIHQNHYNPLFVHGDEFLRGLSVWHIPTFQVVRRLKPHQDPIVDLKYGYAEGVRPGVLSCISKSKLQVFSCSY